MTSDPNKLMNSVLMGRACCRESCDNKYRKIAPMAPPIPT
jgi:hypothetical protein